MQPYEPFSEAVREDPYPYYKRLRDDANTLSATGDEMSNWMCGSVA